MLCHRLCPREPLIVCYLCLSPVKLSTWADGSHRKKCLEKHIEVISLLPSLPSLVCRHCAGALRLWPAQVGGPQFRCDSGLPLCPIGGRDVTNNGSNRYNCFSCDHDLCQGCVRALSSSLNTSIQLDTKLDTVVTVNEDKNSGNVNLIREGHFLLEKIPLIDKDSPEDQGLCCEDQRLSWRLSYDSKDLSPSLFRMEAPLVCGEDFLSCSSTKENLNKL